MATESNWYFIDYVIHWWSLFIHETDIFECSVVSAVARITRNGKIQIYEN